MQQRLRAPYMGSEPSIHNKSTTACLLPGCDSRTDPDAIQIQLVSACMYSPTTAIIKLALFALLYRIFWVLQWLRYLIYAGALTTTLFYFSAMFTIIALCAPTGSQDYVIASQASATEGRFHVRTRSFPTECVRLLLRSS